MQSLNSFLLRFTLKIGANLGGALRSVDDVVSAGWRLCNRCQKSAQLKRFSIVGHF